MRAAVALASCAVLAAAGCASQPPQRSPVAGDSGIAVPAAEASPAGREEGGPEPAADPVGLPPPPQAAEILFDPRERSYPWLEGEPGEPIWRRFEPPDGFARVATGKGTFGNWLRHLPLKPGTPDVLLFDGSLKGRQDVHAAVIDIDVGSRDLQQCVDACMRLRAEYLWSAGRARDVCFRSVGGLEMKWERWAQGYRPAGRGWERTAAPASGWRAFRSYLDKVFGTCNTRSQLEQMVPVGEPAAVEIGHVFLNRPDPDSFGHAVMVVDLAADASGRRAFLLAQSYMPAQEIHVLRNHRDAGRSPWFVLDEGRPLETPEWTFEAQDLVRYPERGCTD